MTREGLPLRLRRAGLEVQPGMQDVPATEGTVARQPAGPRLRRHLVAGLGLVSAGLPVLRDATERRTAGHEPVLRPRHRDARLPDRSRRSASRRSATLQGPLEASDPATKLAIAVSRMWREKVGRRSVTAARGDRITSPTRRRAGDAHSSQCQRSAGRLESPARPQGISGASLSQPSTHGTATEVVFSVCTTFEKKAVQQ